MFITKESILHSKDNSVIEQDYIKKFVFEKVVYHDFRYVVIKGGNNDWAIYYGYSFMNIMMISSSGHKLSKYTDKGLIKFLTNCSEETWQMYRP